MSTFKVKERILLRNIFTQENVPVELGQELLRSAERLSYEIQASTYRVKQYEDLINFHFKKKKGD